MAAVSPGGCSGQELMGRGFSEQGLMARGFSERELAAKGFSEQDLTARNLPGIGAALKNGKIAIAGLGGLGSNLAVMLARIGVGTLFLVDFDQVEPSNLNRQHYHIGHLGVLKADALKEQLENINPFVNVETQAVRVTEANVRELFHDCPIVCEAFDNPEDKAMLVNALLAQGDKKIVAASGMAGLDRADLIQTKKVFRNLYVCGDSQPPLPSGIGLMAPRVMVCAGHQATMAVRLLLGLEEG